jgi:DNA-binding MurR/RpiR family transcriptional regulator
MTGHGAKFGKKKEEAVVALLTQRTMEDAARSIGVSTSTMTRWLNEPEFANAYREARRSAFSQAIARLQQASATAVTVLIKVMVDAATPASSRVRAADSVLNHAAKAIELEDIEVRVSELERAAKVDNK